MTNRHFNLGRLGSSDVQQEVLSDKYIEHILNWAQVIFLKLLRMLLFKLCHSNIKTNRNFKSCHSNVIIIHTFTFVIN